MIYEYAVLTIDSARGAEFDAVIADAERILLSAPGCASASLQRSVDRPELCLLRVGWEDIDDHLVRFPGSEPADRLARTIGRFFVEEPLVAHFRR